MLHCSYGLYMAEKGPGTEAQHMVSGAGEQLKSD
jgi:hypothetical protein